MISINFITDFNEENELGEVLRAFNPHINLDKNGENLTLNFDKTEGGYNVKIIYKNEVFSDVNLAVNPCWDTLEIKRQTKRFCKISLYDFLKNLTGISLPYGSLTGIRPTKLYRDLTDRGENAEDVFLNYFEVSEEKTKLVKSIISNQKPCYNNDQKAVDLFINIPFCPTRCAYCSFISVPIKKLQNCVESYKNSLILEISTIKKAILDNGFKVRAIYVGGGTPTSLTPETLKEILSSVDYNVSEFTVEAGRPDTVNKEVLEMLEDSGVTRISINPQTFNDKTLELIGRRHTVEDFYRAYELSRNCKFDINIDLIAALPGENFYDFKLSVDSAVKLRPENLTVHTLALKRGTVLTLEKYDNTDSELAKNMVDYAYEKICSAGYNPYYMYRQKNMCGNLENTGYSLKGKECLYNIDIMEEDTNILAAGSGAISKKIDYKLNQLTRKPNFKDVREYLNRFDEIIDKTAKFWEV